MSANRSWDIQPRPAKQVRRTPDPVITRASRARPSRVSPSLGARRKNAKKRLVIELLILLVVVVGAGVYGLWQPSVRIQNVQAAGIHTDSVPQMAITAIAGTYARIAPKNSIFLVPEDSIRAAVLGAFPDVEAVSVRRTGFDSLSVNAIARTAAFAWCGVSVDAATDSCYEADSDGFIYAPIAPMPATDASSSPSLVPPGTLMVYGPLVEATSSDASAPLRSTVSEASLIPEALRFTRAIDSLGADVLSLQLRGDEADLFLKGGTRVTYLLGHEQDAANLAAATFPGLHLNDGSIDYIDLRFDGKVYYKNAGS